MSVFTVMMVTVVAIIGVNLFRAITKQYDIWIILSVSVIIFSFVLTQLADIIDFITSLRNFLPLESNHFLLLGKIVGISFLGEFVSSLCIDSGMKSVATNVEIACKCSVLMLSIPLFKEILKIVEDLIM